MADIIFKYTEMSQAATDIADLATQYQSAADTFESEFLAAVTNWEGATKDKLSTFISGPVKDYMGSTVPKLLNSLSELLRANVEQMQSADQQIADNIPSSLN